MDSNSLTTIGKSIYPGREVKIFCLHDTDTLEHHCELQRFRIVYIKDGHAIFQNSGHTQIVTSPAILCLNHEDEVRLQKAVDIRMDIMYFDPFCFGRYVEYRDYDDWKMQLQEDAYFFRPFFDRTDTYIGSSSTNYSIGQRISQLITLAGEELSGQKDSFWPCRSRSYFIELLLNVTSVFNGDLAHEKVFCGQLSEDTMKVIDWLQIHYLEKVVLEDITKEFHTNKTTLNNRFKAEIGLTVTDYIIRLRMQIACSLLRKTFLSINEIMERSGYRDDAHFLRSFKKYAGCTPSEYRNQFE